jgi:hypothetical protein
MPQNQQYPWWKAAMDHGSLNKSWFKTDPGSEEFKAWQKYFDLLGWQPRFFKEAHFRPNREITLPCQWPEWMSALEGRTR